MLKENTIKREMRRLRKIIDERNVNDIATQKRTGIACPVDPITREAYGAECFGQWVLGGCTWTPSGLVTKE